MSQPSNPEPLKDSAWDHILAANDGSRCVAHRKNGQRCRRFAIAGAKVCRVHGGAAKHVRAAARARLENAADRLARQLLKMATDESVSDAVKLKAITEALDRGGLGAKSEIEVALKPYEQIAEQATHLVTTSRDAYRNGTADDAIASMISSSSNALNASARDSILDAEILEPEDEFAMRIADHNPSHVDASPPRDVPDAPERQPRERTAPATAHSGGSTDGAMTLHEAAEAAADLRRNAVSRPMRALPPGRGAR